jgi:hypothetical protein
MLIVTSSISICLMILIITASISITNTGCSTDHGQHQPLFREHHALHQYLFREP